MIQSEGHAGLPLQRLAPPPLHLHLHLAGRNRIFAHLRRFAPTRRPRAALANGGGVQLLLGWEAGPLEARRRHSP